MISTTTRTVPKGRHPVAHDAVMGLRKATMKNILNLLPEIIQVIGKLIAPKNLDDKIKWAEWKLKSKFEKKRLRVKWRQERRALKKEYRKKK